MPSKRRSSHASAVVTGAGSGIGRAFALELARRGGRIVCADIDERGAAATVAAITTTGGDACVVACDVTNEQQVHELADTAERWLGAPADLVVNNAGIGAGGSTIGETPLADWRKTLGVNLWGVLYGCHVFAPRMRAAARPGGIINVASAASFAAAPLMGAYNVSKAGVLALSETLAAELAGTDITVTVLCPTFVKTNIVRNSEHIAESSQRLATALMKWTGVSADRIARTTLDAHDRGQLHVVPQLDARLVWRVKRLVPGTYTRALGLFARLGR